MLSSACSLEGLQRAGYYLLHRALQRRAAQERGLALVLDFRGFSLAHLYAVRWADLRRGVAMLQECFPARLCTIYVLHEPRWLLLLVRLLRPLLSQESMQQKFKLCGAGEGLWPHLPPEHLPASLDLGGHLELDWEAQLRSWEAEEAEEEARAPLGWDPTALLDAPIEVPLQAPPKEAPKPGPSGLTSGPTSGRSAALPSPSTTEVRAEGRGFVISL
jgi:hypothetical protein